MPETTDINARDIELAFETIKAKREKYNLLYDYYKGAHPLYYSTQKLKDAFDKLNTFFAENWIAVVVDAVLDRIQLKGFDVSVSEEANTLLDDLWKQYNLHLLADDVHEAAQITGEGYAIALRAGDELDEQPLDIYFNDPRVCHVFYQPDRPSVKRMGAKLYIDEEDYMRLVLYYVDEILYYKTRTRLKKGQWPSSYKSFIPDDELPSEPHDYNVVPVFHWQSFGGSKKRDIGPSEVSMQDAINKLLSDMLISSEFNALTQRIIISQADPGNLSRKAGAYSWIPAADTGQGTSVLEVGGGKELDGFLNAIDKLATSLGIITRTPKHFFFAQGGDPSGEALIAMEAPLNKKVKKKLGRHSVEWQNLAKHLLALSGIDDVKRSDIIPQWEPPETIQPLTRANIVKTEADSGIPLITAVRRQGWTNQDIKQMQKDKKDERKEASSVAKETLAALRAQDNQNNDTSQLRRNGVTAEQE